MANIEENISSDESLEQPGSKPDSSEGVPPYVAHVRGNQAPGALVDEDALSKAYSSLHEKARDQGLDTSKTVTMDISSGKMKGFARRGAEPAVAVELASAEEQEVQEALPLEVAEFLRERAGDSWDAGSEAVEEEGVAVSVEGGEVAEPDSAVLEQVKRDLEARIGQLEDVSGNPIIGPEKMQEFAEFISRIDSPDAREQLMEWLKAKAVPREGASKGMGVEIVNWDPSYIYNQLPTINRVLSGSGITIDKLWASMKNMQVAGDGQVLRKMLGDLEAAMGGMDERTLDLVNQTILAPRIMMSGSHPLMQYDFQSMINSINKVKSQDPTDALMDHYTKARIGEDAKD